MKKSLLDSFLEEDFNKVATAFDEPVDKMPGPVQSSYKSTPKNIDYNSGGSSFMKVTPGAVIGAGIGLVLGQKKGKKQMEKAMQVELNKFNNAKPVIEGNYYQQAQHVMDNLGVVFTPFGTVYTLKNKNKNVAIDTIETGEMNSNMKEAWKKKDGDYFKNLMLAKMYSEMQMAEQSFARQLLEVSKSNEKNASEYDYDVYEMNDLDVICKVAELEDYITTDGRGTEEHFEKVCSIEDYFEELDDIQFDLKLDRPFDKYASIMSGIKSSLGLGQTQTVQGMQKQFGKESYLKKNLKVGFMPDRVLFVVDNTLVSTLPLTNMNVDGYNNFQKQNKKYFVDLFTQEMKKSQSFNKVAFVESENPQELSFENIETNDIREIFSKSMIHPVVYYLVITKKLSTKWFDYDPLALVKIIETEFNLEEPLSDGALDKILSIQTANNSQSVYTVPHAFEKVVRAFNSKPVDFLEKEDDDLDVEDFAFAIDILDRVTPLDDIYDNFSPEVLDYIASTLARKGSKSYIPSYIVGSPLEPKFQEVLNEVLLKTTNKFTTSDVIDTTLETQISEKNGYIHDMSISVTKAVRRALENKDVDIAVIVSEMIKRIGVPNDLVVMVKREVVKNLAVDEVLKTQEDNLRNQLEKYNITGGGEELNV